MKVLQVINSLDTGGAEKLILDGYPKFLNRGVQMEVMLLNGKEYPFLLLLRKIPNIVIHSSPKLGVYNPFHIIRILRVLNSYNVVHVHLFPSLYWAAIARFLSFSNTALVFTEHNTTNGRRNKNVLKWIERFIYKQYKYIITISKEVDRQLKDHLNIDSKKFELIPNGVDLSKLDSANPIIGSEFSANEGAKIILQVSSFTKQKDQMTLIRSLQHISFPFKLLLVGEGETIEECKKLSKELKLDSHIQFLGIRTDVASLLKTADFVVLSSYYEGLSLSSIEGLGSGRPFIASRAPGLIEVVDGAGVLFPIGDDQTLAFEIEKLNTDSQYYSQIVDSCMRRAKEYNIENYIDKHIVLYKNLCQSQD